jgi:hypothetical protein
MTHTTERLCDWCGRGLPKHNHGRVHHTCASAAKAAAVRDGNAEAVLARAVSEESSLLPWERHPEPWDNVVVRGGGR